MYHELSRDTETENRGYILLTRYRTDLRLTGSVIVGLGVVDWVWTQYARVAFVGWSPIAFFLALLVTIGVFYGYSGRSNRLSDAGIYAALWVAFSVVGAILTYAAATVRMPLRDAEFARIDAALGFDWIQWLRFVGSHQLLQRILAIAYATMLPQIIGSIIYFAHTERIDRNRELLCMAIFSLIASTAIASILPAISPYIRLHGVQPEDSQVMLNLRDGTISTVTLGQMQGIIEFPSFHTVIAVLLMYVHRMPSRSFVPVLILNFFMLLSLPSGGHHYLVDLIAGAAVATLSIGIVRTVTRKQYRSSRTIKSAPKSHRSFAN
jgi:hypothetical protein